MKYTQKEIILNVLKNATSEYTVGYKLEKVSTEWGWLGNQAGRRLRELENEGKIERKLIGRYVHYRIKKIEPIKASMYRPTVKIELQRKLI